MKISFEVSSCLGCPCKSYDSDYGRSYDSGYDCNESGNRIVNDNEETRWNRWKRELEENNKLLVPMSEEELNDLPHFKGWFPEDPFKIPDDCPFKLEEVE